MSISTFNEDKIIIKKISKDESTFDEDKIIIKKKIIKKISKDELNLKKGIKLMCVSYVHKFSARNNAFNDLMISFNKHIFAAGSKRLKHFKEGDYIIICGENKDFSNRRLCFLAKINNKLDEILMDWKNEGGKEWTYNFTITPLTGITDISTSSSLRKKISNIFQQLNLNSNNLFNSRFCSEKLLEGLNKIFSHGLFNPLSL
jgi:hypothetical protein